MADPLDYRNPRTPDRPVQSRESSPPPARRPMAVVPAEFDLLLTRSDDLAAVNAVEAALRRAGIPTFRCDDGALTGRIVQLHIRSADRDRGTQIAGQIFARRKRVKTFPRPEIPPDGPAPNTTLGALPIWP